MAQSAQIPNSISISTEREILPKNLKPIHYDITVEPYLEKATEFDGTVIIDLEVLEKTSSISLNAIDLKILKTEVFSGDGKPIEIRDLEFDTVKERETVGLKQTLTVGQRISLKQSFKGSLLHQSSAFFRSPVIGADGKTTWMVSTQLEATDARRVFPSFDEPALKATFAITIVADKGLTCLSNMDVASEVDVGKAKKAVTFNISPLMSTYIVAFAIGDLKMIETNKFRVPVRVYASADKNIEHGRYGLELAARALETFEKLFDIDFPLPKLDLIAVPGGQGAMENWGLVTFGDSYLLNDEVESSAESFRRASSVIVHELAHQWFGNLVTMEFWDGLWLNESFADWAQLYAWETLEPTWQMWQSHASGGYQNALELDGNTASHPIEMVVNKATEIGQIFDDISYNKGCSVLWMISRYLGIEVFVRGVQKYLKRAAYGNALTGDLWNALSEVSDHNVREIMETWTKQGSYLQLYPFSRPIEREVLTKLRTVGYPVVHVTEDEAEGTITVTQHRFLQDGTADPEDDKVLYPLSLRIRTKSGVDDNINLYDRTKTIKLSLDFFKLNADHYGFYRVLYTPKRLQKLGQNARDGLLSPEDKIGLISDAISMGGSARAKTSSVLNLIGVFDVEVNFFVWKQALHNLDQITSSWDFEPKPVKDALKVFRTRLVSNTLIKIGWKFTDGEDKVQQMFKALIFSKSSENPRVIKAACEMFEKFLAGDSRAININIQESVFAIVLERGGVEEYEAILKAVQSTSNIDKRNLCLSALGYASKPELIARTLEYAMSPEIIAINEYYRVLGSLTKHAAGKEALWNWLKTNADLIQQKTGQGLGRFARIVKLCTSFLSTKEQWQDVKDFFEGKDTEEYNVYLAQSLGFIWAIASWVERDREDVKEWLETNDYLTTSE